MMPCAPHFRSIQRLIRLCTIQDDADVSVPEENVYCPYVAAPWPSFSDSMDGHIFSAWRALLFRVGHTKNTHCLWCIALVPAEVGVSWTVSPPRPEHYPPQAGNLRSAVVLSVQFSHMFPVTRTSCFARATQCVEWVKQLIRVRCHVAGVMESNWHCDVLFSIRVVHWGSVSFRCCHRIPSFVTVLAASRPVPLLFWPPRLWVPFFLPSCRCVFIFSL